MLNVLIVDDEPPAHDVLLHHCRAHVEMRVVAQCHSAAQALAALETMDVDVMFLDIRMPRFGGLDLLRGLGSPPLTVIVSAYHEHALDGFELDVVDYLLKPVSEERFAAALEKVRRRLEADRQSDPAPDVSVVLKIDRALRRFLVADIAYFEAQGNFVKVWTHAESFLATTTMCHLLASLPADRFVRVHKSFIVNRMSVVEQDAGSILLDCGRRIPIGRTYRAITSLLK